MDDCTKQIIDQLQAKNHRLRGYLDQLEGKNHSLQEMFKQTQRTAARQAALFRRDQNKKIPLPDGLYKPNAEPTNINYPGRLNIYDDFALKSLFHIFWVVRNYSNMERNARRDRLKPVKAGAEI